MKAAARNGDLTRYAALLRRYGNDRALVEGKDLHCELARFGYDEEALVGNLLVRMYGCCGSLEDARRAFDKIQELSIFSWAILMLAYAQNGHVEAARKMFHLCPAYSTELWNSMITGFSQQGYVREAKTLFDGMPFKDTISWNAMIAAFAQNGHFEAALKLYRIMSLDGARPTSATFVSTLDSCANLLSLRDGQILASHIDETCGIAGLLVRNALLYMYTKCGCLQFAVELFYKMPEWSVASWNTIIAALAENGSIDEATRLFNQMPERSTISWIVMISAYGEAGLIEEAARTFDQAPKNETMCWNAMLGAFAHKGHLQEAECLFRSIPKKSAVSWNTMISAYNRAGNPIEALRCYQMMNLHGESPTSVTLISALDACSRIDQVRSIHRSYCEKFSQPDSGFGLGLIRLYGKLGQPGEAKAVFDELPRADPTICAAILTAFAENGRIEEAGAIFEKMPQRDMVASTIMLSAHAQQGTLQQAIKIFTQMPLKDPIAWNAMLWAYSQAGHHEEALGLLPVMDLEGTQPDSATFNVLLQACAAIPSLPAGKNLHSHILQDDGIRIELDPMLGNALVNMYGKCGSPDDARVVFDSVIEKNVLLWSSMLGAYCHSEQESQSEKGLGFFRLMILQGIQPDEVTFMSLLCSCSHGGQLKAAAQHFASISRDYNLVPSVKHFICLLDLLGRLGVVTDAEELIAHMPYEPQSEAWISLLGASKLHGDLAQASVAAAELARLNPSASASYLVLSNLNAEVANHEQAES